MVYGFLFEKYSVACTGWDPQHLFLARITRPCCCFIYIHQDQYVHDDCMTVAFLQVNLQESLPENNDKLLCQITIVTEHPEDLLCFEETSCLRVRLFLTQLHNFLKMCECLPFCVVYGKSTSLGV